MTEKYLNANGVRLAYEDFGDKKNPALVLIMGLATQMIAWPEALCEQLADEGFWVIRFDNRDIGLSEKMEGARVPNIPKMVIFSKLGIPSKAPYALTDMADDTIGLLDALGIDKAHIVGVSMGGMIGQLLTAKAADRVHTFTSIMSTSGNKKLPSAKREITQLMLRRPANSEAAIIAHRMEVLRSIGSPGFPAKETELRKKIVRSYRRNYYPEGGLRHIAAIIHSASRVKILRTITRPTLVIHGKHDALVPVEAGIDTARNIKGARLELFDGMGHDLPVELIPQFVGLMSEHAKAHQDC